MGDDEAFAEAVRTLLTAEPTLSIKPLLARIQLEHPDWTIDSRRAREANHAIEVIALVNSSRGTAEGSLGMAKGTSVP